MKPSVSRIVHYRSYGTPNGEYSAQCRAAVITEVGAWITTVTVATQAKYVEHGYRNVRHLTQEFRDDAVSLTVFNPTGLFFNGAGLVACLYDETGEVPGTWHWPERVEE